MPSLVSKVPSGSSDTTAIVSVTSHTVIPAYLGWASKAAWHCWEPLESYYSF